MRDPERPSLTSAEDYDGDDGRAAAAGVVDDVPQADQPADTVHADDNSLVVALSFR